MIRQHREVQADLTALAAILARGFLRLTENRRPIAVLSPGETQKGLDLRAEPSPCVVDGRPRWKRASSIESRRFDG